MNKWDDLGGFYTPYFWKDPNIDMCIQHPTKRALFIPFLDQYMVYLPTFTIENQPHV